MSLSFSPSPGGARAAAPQVPAGAAADGARLAGAPRIGATRAEQKARGVRGPRADPVAFVRDDGHAPAGDRGDLPDAEPAEPDGAREQPRLQRASAAPVRRVASRDARSVPRRARAPLPLPVPQHGEQEPALRIPAINVAGRGRRAREDGRLGRDKLSPADGDHPALPAHHGDRVRAQQDRGDLHRPEGAARRRGADVRLRHGRALLRRRHRPRQHGPGPRRAALDPTAQAHRPVLPPPERQPPRARGASTVPPRRAPRPHVRSTHQGRPHRPALALLPALQHLGTGHCRHAGAAVLAGRAVFL